MLCSFAELGWLVGGPDEVAVLHGLRPGYCLDDLAIEQRAEFAPALLPVVDRAVGTVVSATPVIERVAGRRPSYAG